MKVLVISDSHSHEQKVRAVIEKEKDCPFVFFLGDGLCDIEKCKDSFPDRRFIRVRGNNDIGFPDEYYAYRFIEGNTVVATHGHMDSVRCSFHSLISRAVSVRANVVFYGHTHRADVYRDPGSGVVLINPGALVNGRYAVVTLDKNGVDAELKALE